MTSTWRFTNPTKYLLFVLLACALTAFCADPDREIAKKEVTEHLASFEEANRWFLTPVSFKQWLDTVTFSGWQSLHSVETETSYYALLRHGDYLVFWHRSRDPLAKLPAEQSSIEVTSKEDGKSVWEKPSVRAVIDYRLEYPGGAITARSPGDAFKIKDGFHGTLILNFSKATKEETKERSVYRQEVLWTK